MLNEIYNRQQRDQESALQAQLTREKSQADLLKEAMKDRRPDKVQQYEYLKQNNLLTTPEEEQRFWGTAGSEDLATLKWAAEHPDNPVAKAILKSKGGYTGPYQDLIERMDATQKMLEVEGLQLSIDEKTRNVVATMPDGTPVPMTMAEFAQYATTMNDPSKKDRAIELYEEWKKTAEPAARAAGMQVQPFHEWLFDFIKAGTPNYFERSYASGLGSGKAALETDVRDPESFWSFYKKEDRERLQSAVSYAAQGVGEDNPMAVRARGVAQSVIQMALNKARAAHPDKEVFYGTAPNAQGYSRTGVWAKKGAQLVLVQEMLPELAQLQPPTIVVPSAGGK